MKGSTAYGNNNAYPNRPLSTKSLGSSQEFNSDGGNDDDIDATPFAPLEVEEYDSDLNVSNDEPESWSELVDKKVHRRMQAKEIKRQDVIYELIQTESQYVRTLVIMKKIYIDGLQRHLNYTPEILRALFPCLDELLDLNGSFVRDMKWEQTENSEHFVVGRIGSIILKHFGGENGKLFRDCYGYFCSHHVEAVALYKKFWKNDMPFQQFCKSRLMDDRSGRLSIPEIIQYVTMRMTKYPLLLDAIIKATKETDPDHADLKKSLEAIKEILHGVDEDVDAHEQQKELANLINLVDSKYFVEIKNDATKGKPHQVKADKLFNRRTRLLYDKKVMLKSKNKLYDTRMVILNDKIIFFQENGGKFQLLNADNKMPYISLKGLLIRENAADSKALFLLSKSDQLVEIYEIIFEKNKDKPELMPKLEKYIANCPDEDENDTDNEEDARKDEDERLRRLKELIEQLETTNQEMKNQFETKNKIVQQLIEVTDEDGCVKENFSTTDTKTIDVYNTRSILEDFVGEVNAVLHACSTTPLSPESSPSAQNRTFPPSSHQVATMKKAQTFGDFDHRSKPNIVNNRTSKSMPRGMSEPDIMAPSKRRQSQLMQVLGRTRGNHTAGSEDLDSSNFVPISLAEIQVYQHLSEGLASLLQVTSQQDLEIARMRSHLKDSRTLHAKAEAELSEMRERLMRQQEESEKQLRTEKENYSQLSKEYKRLKLAEQQRQLAEHQRHMVEQQRRHKNPNSEEMIV